LSADKPVVFIRWSCGSKATESTPLPLGIVANTRCEPIATTASTELSWQPINSRGTSRAWDQRHRSQTGQGQPADAARVRAHAGCWSLVQVLKTIRRMTADQKMYPQTAERMNECGDFWFLLDSAGLPRTRVLLRPILKLIHSVSLAMKKGNGPTRAYQHYNMR